MNRRAYLALLLCACLAFGSAVMAFAITGAQTRYWADDYCYTAVLRTDGFWRAQVSFYQHTSDRYSVIPLVGISEMFGPQAIRVWPAVAVLLAGASGVWALGLILTAAGTKFSLVERLFVVLIVLFFTLWQAPNLFQSLYWRSGMLTYFMPLIFLTFMAGLLVWLACREQLRGWGVPLIVLLAFMTGGFSETTAALQAGSLGLVIAAGLVVARWGSAAARGFARRLAGWAGWALLGTLAAMLVLYFSPSNQLRLVHMPEPAPLPVLIGLSLRYALDFMVDTVKTQPLPTLLSGLSFLALSLAYHAARWPGYGAVFYHPRHAARMLLLSVAVTYLLIVCVCAPSVYVEVAYPEPRALIAGRLVMVLGLAAGGWASGKLLLALISRFGADRLKGGLVLAGALVLLGLLSLYPLRSASLILQKDLPYYQARAAGWDDRDSQIRAAIAQGQRSLEVPALDSIAGLMELTSNPRVFPNTCTAAAYGLDSLTGVIE